MSYTDIHVRQLYDSANRIKGTNTNPHFQIRSAITFSQKINKRYYAKLTDIYIPNFNNINANNNTLIITEHNTTLTITVPSGNYNINDLIAVIQNLLNNASANNTYTLTYDDITQKVNFSFVGTSPNVIINSYNTGSTLDIVIGANKRANLSQNVNILENTPTDLPYKILINDMPYINLQTNITSTNLLNEEGTKLPIQVDIPNNVNLGDSIFFSNEDEEPVKIGKSTIQTIEAKLIDLYGNELDLGGNDFTFVLEIWERTI